MTKKNIQVVCDAGPIIHLDELNSLEILCQFDKIILADAVWAEINIHRPSALKKKGPNLFRWSEGYPTEESLLTMCRMLSLDLGEIEALAIMEKNPTATFLTDDAAARLVAQKMGYRVHGSIGIIVRTIRKGLMTPEQVLKLLQEIPSKTTLHIRHSLLQEVIGEIKTRFSL